MSWIKKIFKGDDTTTVPSIPSVNTELPIINRWGKFEDEKPPNEVVLGACDTYDCGWVMDTVWWYEDNQCWMTTGPVQSTEGHLPYTHWRKLPPNPGKDIKKIVHSEEYNIPSNVCFDFVDWVNLNTHFFKSPHTKRWYDKSNYQGKEGYSRGHRFLF